MFHGVLLQLSAQSVPIRFKFNSSKKKLSEWHHWVCCLLQHHSVLNVKNKNWTLLTSVLFFKSLLLEVMADRKEGEPNCLSNKEGTLQQEPAFAYQGHTLLIRKGKWLHWFIKHQDGYMQVCRCCILDFLGWGLRKAGVLACSWRTVHGTENYKSFTLWCWMNSAIFTRCCVSHMI